MKGKEKEELFRMLMNEIVPLREKISYKIDRHGFPCKGSRVRKELADEWTLGAYWKNERFALTSQNMVAEFEKIPQKVITQGNNVKTLFRITKEEDTGVGYRLGKCKCGNIVKSYQKFCDECGTKLNWGNVRA